MPKSKLIDPAEKLRARINRGALAIAGVNRADETEDDLELRDPTVREHIQKSRDEVMAKKSRPMEEFLAGRSAKKPQVQPKHDS